MVALIVGLTAGFAGCVLGGLVGYETGHADGVDEVVRYYEFKARHGGAK